MMLDGSPLVDPKSVLPYYENRKIISDLVRKCNGQEFRYINGYGKGYYLTTEEITDETVSITFEARTVSVKILDKISLEHPNHSGGLYCYIAAEPKYELTEFVVERNYNIIVDKTLSTTSIPTFLTMEEDGADLTLEQVITKFLDEEGVSLVYEVQELNCYDIAIEGMNFLEALDHICAIYGFVWTFYSTTNEVHIWKFNEPDPEGPHRPTYTHKMNNMNWSKLDPPISDISVAFPVYDYRRRSPKEFHIEYDNTTTQGQGLTLYDPYYPAFLDASDELRNAAPLTTRKDLIKTNMINLHSSVILMEKHHWECKAEKPIALSELHGDWGYGRRSIFRWIPYPFREVPEFKAHDRLAWNWRGTLAHTYFSPEGDPAVEYFVVTPVVGFDGELPPDPQRVENIYEWDYGEEGWPVRVEWNPIDNQWEAIQQKYECPPDDAENEEPPEYEDVYVPPDDEE